MTHAALAAWMFLAATPPAATQPNSGVPLPRVGGERLQGLLTPAGRPRLIHLWASWCGPCLAEWPSLAEALRRWAPDVDIVTLALEAGDAGEGAQQVLGHVPTHVGEAAWAPMDEAFPVIRGLDAEWDGALPTTVLLGSDGKVALLQRGITLLKPLDAAIQELPRAKTVKRREKP